MAENLFSGLHFSRFQAMPLHRSAGKMALPERVAPSEKIKIVIFRGRWCDVVNLIVGVSLFLSPWVLGFGGVRPDTAEQTAAVFGAMIGVTALAALTAFEVWEQYIIIAASLGAMASPWIFGLSAEASVAHLVLGTTSLVLSLCRLWLLGQVGRAGA